VPIAPLDLDDLTWAEMTAAIRRRIPAESDGQWTLHAPVDPGITLLELYAWLLEQRLYWLDQVPDALVAGVLELLDVGAPRPALAAGTVLAIDDAAGPVVPARTTFARDERAEIVFTTDTSVCVLPVQGLRLEVDGRDRTAELAARAGVALLHADGTRGEVRIELNMARPAPGDPGERLSLLLELDVPDRVRPAWHPEAVADVPPPAATTWWYEHVGGMTQFDPADVQDGTQGLRRSGVVRLRVPQPWRAEPPGGPRPHALLLRTERGTFSSPPRLLQLAVNVAVARHRRRVLPNPAEQQQLEAQAREWRSLPGQRLELPGARDRLLSAQLRLRERDGRLHRWRVTNELAFHGRADRVFLLDRTAGALRFGDGRTGRVPVVFRGQHPGPLLRVRWELGAGVAGNGGTSSHNWRPLDGGAVIASNLVPAVGGQEPETIEEARRRAAAALLARHRAVTRADFETVARETPGVAVSRADTAVGGHPGHPCRRVPGAVSVIALPEVPRGEDDFDRTDFMPTPRLDPGAARAVRDRLGTARLLCAEVFLRDPVYRQARLRVEFAGAPADPDGLRRRLQAGLRRYLDPLRGGDDATGWPFGEPLRPSVLLRVAQAAAARDAEVAAVSIQLDGQGAWEDCDDVPIGAHDLVALQDVRVRFGRTAAQPEGLQ
jgi:hypothetical protein